MNRKRIIQIITLFSVLTVSSFCVVFSPFERKNDGTNEVGSLGLSVTPSPVPTLVPTNLVKLKDSGDSLPPKPIIIYPSGGQEIGSKGVIRVQFDQSMDANKTSKAWSLLDPSGKSIQGQIEWPREDTLQFSPKNHLKPGCV